MWGKASTFVQVLTVVVCMAGSVGQARAMLWPCAAFTIWSGIHYTWRTLQLLRDPA
jgi:phosphatidylglycerophosphate synthase